LLSCKVKYPKVTQRRFDEVRDGLSEERLLIDGGLVGAEGGRTHPNVNPATEEVARHAPDASAGDMDRAIAAARRAFDSSHRYVETKTIALPVP
jgi:hypothetical protein